MRNLWIGMVAVVLGAGFAGADATQDINVPYLAQEGEVIIDADLSDWTGSTWVPLDTTYASGGGLPADITGGQWAVRWSDDDNLLFVGAQVTDTQHHLAESYTAWNGQDDVEIYIDAGNNDNESPVSYEALQELAQQLVVGVSETNNAWAIMNGFRPVNSDLVPSYAAKYVGDVLYYEVAIAPYSYYAGYGGLGELQQKVELVTDLQIGLDLVAGTMMDDQSFSMASNNIETSKFREGSALQTWQLVGGSSGPDCAARKTYGDFNCDGEVGLLDLDILGQKWGFDVVPPCEDLPDANDDCKVGLLDLDILGQNWGITTPIPEPAMFGLLMVGGLTALRRW